MLWLSITTRLVKVNGQPKRNEYQSDERSHRCSYQRADEQPRGCKQEKNWNKRVTPSAVHAFDFGHPSANKEHRSYNQPEEDPVSEYYVICQRVVRTRQSEDAGPDPLNYQRADWHPSARRNAGEFVGKEPLGRHRKRHSRVRHRRNV